MIMAVEDFEVIMICVHILVLSLTRCVTLGTSCTSLSLSLLTCKMEMLKPAVKNREDDSIKYLAPSWRNSKRSISGGSSHR